MANHSTHRLTSHTAHQTPSINLTSLHGPAGIAFANAACGSSYKRQAGYCMLPGCTAPPDCCMIKRLPTPPNAQPPLLILLLHLEKTGGSTVRSVLQQSVNYTLAITAYDAVQDINAKLKRDPHAVSAEQRRRQVLLCIFVCALDVESRHRVRFMRRTIQLMMRSGNWGLAAMYLDVLREHAQKNRDKENTARQLHKDFEADVEA